MLSCIERSVWSILYFSVRALAMPPDTRSIATAIHCAPPPPVILGVVDKEPATAFAGAHAHEFPIG